MLRPQLPLNALRAFEAAARHQNFTRAALELCVSQAALSHQIRALEDRLGVSLFTRLPRGVALTDEGARLYPVLNEAFDRIAVSLDRFVGGHFREVLSVGVVGTFATGWLLPRLGISTRAIRISNCACRPTTTASIWPVKGWTWRSGSVMAIGRGRSAMPYWMPRSRRCVHLRWHVRCGSRAILPTWRCCAPTAATSGHAGCRPLARRNWTRVGRCSIHP